MIATIAASQVNRFSVNRDRSDDSTVFFLDDVDHLVNEKNLVLEHLSEITYTFWKPIEIPIDVTVAVSPK